MAADTIIVLAPKGTARREVKPCEIEVPDLWHIAMWLKAHQMERESQMVLETWHLAIDLRDHIKES
ncbi:MAG: hypothetical protein A2Y38_19475 [Spirochaetes bacterium GWB1_59_5]|nr:MAG: hypothetical protein A2Y38_19475 [Spirochaetes bacterium GWB1_59_5]